MLQKLGYSSKQFLIWFCANILGFGALGASILVFPSILGISGFFITTFIIAIPISLAQWIALRRILQTSILWILTIPIGVPLSFLILRVIPAGLWFDADDDSLVAMTSMLLVTGLIIGLLQWIIFRRQLVRAAIWLLGSAIGVAGSFWVILVTGLIDQSGIISYIIVALVYSSVTGLFLSGLLAYNNQYQPNLANVT
jgi:hypothetical protein